MVVAAGGKAIERGGLEESQAQWGPGTDESLI